MTYLLHKYYVNKGALSQDNIPEKFCCTFKQKVCLQQGVELSIEILYIIIAQGAAKLP